MDYHLIDQYDCYFITVKNGLNALSPLLLYLFKIINGLSTLSPFSTFFPIPLTQ